MAEIAYRFRKYTSLSPAYRLEDENGAPISALPVAPRTGTVSAANSTSTPLDAAATFTGTAEDVSGYNSVVIAVKTDQDGTYTIQFSTDGTNWDSTLTRYYRTTQIEAPHRFTVTRQYMRVTFTNTSASNQTFIRLQTSYGDKAPLNVPIDAVVAPDYDATIVRPTNYRHEVTLGRRQGAGAWNKFGYNQDVDVGTEVVASFGGTFAPLTTASTLTISSTSVADTDGGTGAQGVVIYGVDANRVAQIAVVTLSGTTPVVTAQSWLGVNRMSIYLAGSGQANAGTITATATTGGATQAQMPTGDGTTQQCIFFTQLGHTALAEWLTIHTVKPSGQNPTVTVKGWVFSAVSNAKYNVLNETFDTAVETSRYLSLPIPFPIGERSAFWLEATTDRADTVIECRFSLIEYRDADA